eukprot:TRINITY_DN3874_c0_g1_i7.p1 TRINITY_DN3874_c0_g1~~TRINITY_DN3874_c0_g1_i7.p1  ORF type:complete len:104 (-),score=20.17 TRINITY_DN3874_c0_g1_i7:2-313(-)
MQLHSSAFEQVAAVIEHIITNFDPNLCCSIGNILFPTPFDAVEVPEISVKDYLGRIREYSRCSESCYVIAFIYICLLYTSDAADDSLRVDLGGRRIIKKKKKI